MRYLRRLFFPAILLASRVALAQSNLVLLISPPGDYIGAGQTYYTTNQDEIGISGTLATITVWAFGFAMYFDAPDQSNLTVERYTNVVAYPRNWNEGGPGLTIMGNGRSCLGTACGDFEIREVQTNGNGQVTHFWVTLSHQCHCHEAPLTGEIRYNSLLAPPVPAPRTLRVPADFPTIQSALDNINMLSFDTVLVDPGVYVESVQFGAKRARLASLEGPSATYISAPTGSVAVAFTGATPDAVLSGFTIEKSTTAIYISHGGSPTIVSNTIVNCGDGIICNSGRSDILGSPVIRGNAIIGCSGGAIGLAFTGTPLVEGNVMEDNAAGIGMGSAGAPVIRNNIIRRNRGDGIGMGNYSDPNILQNLIIGNVGNGISWLVPEGGRGPWIVNNTIVDNGGAGIAANGYDGASRIVNNVIVGSPALWVGDFNDTNPPVIEFNDVYSAASNAYSGLITNLTGIAGNISADPFFTCQPGDDFHLLADSACIDSGTNLTALLSGTDLSGRARTLVGHTNGQAQVDVGAFEFDLASPPVPCLFLYCPSNIVVIAAPAQNSTVVNYPAPFATPGSSVGSSPTSGSIFAAGDHTVGVTAVYGTNVMNCSFTITVLTTVDFVSALNSTNRNWITDGDAAWFVENAVTRDGSAAAQSGPITHNQSSTLRTSLPGPGLLNFWWKVSSEANRDFLYVTLEGETIASISGQVDWRQQTLYLASGAQIVEWTYAKDASGTHWGDVGWLDLVSYTQGITPPIITLQPTNQAPAPGMNLTFSVVAIGTPPLTYQWQLNRTKILGATNSFLSFTNVQASDVGNYVVSVSNPGGSTNSNSAKLSLSQVVAWGVNTYGQANAPELTNVIAIAGGWHHSAALKAEGTVSAWGANINGQTSVPTGLSNIVAISSRSGDHILGLRATGTVVAWGDNSYRQTNVPAGLADVVAIAAGGFHSIGLKADGTVTAWGDNSYHQTSVPADLTNVVAIAAGDHHSLALKADGTLTAWGQYYTGGAFVPAAVPASLIGVAAIAAGSDHDLALVASGGPKLQAPVIDPRWSGNNFAVSLPTQSGRVYSLDYKDSLADGNWTALPLVAGNGATETLADSTASGTQRFYRVRRW